jgi:metal-responsive CopG/Arc/MetJ family transcriptional regulator
MPVTAFARKVEKGRTAKGRVLVEFPENLLKRADEVAEEMKMSRSELIRTALERRIQEFRTEKFEQELAEGYLVNAEMNRDLVEEFKHVDNEAF